jgi:cell division protein FtsB
LSKVANTYWVDERIRSQSVSPRETSSFAPGRQISLDITGVRAAVRSRDGIIPSWVIFGMIILAAFAVCVTVTMRTRTRMNIASERYFRMQTDVETLRRTNQILRADVEQLHSDPRVIESAARSRLNLVRVNEIVVPIE